jgi:hypothetical protein
VPGVPQGLFLDRFLFIAESRLSCHTVPFGASCYLRSVEGLSQDSTTPVSLLFEGPSGFDNTWQWDRLSATNCSKVYDLSFSQWETSSLEDAGWPWGFKLKTEHVWDAFVILSLLRDCEGHGLQLEVLHTGFQKDQFTIAMRQRNSRFVREGQPEIDHWC